MKPLKSSKPKGQALVEYLLIFSFLTLFVIGMAKGLSKIIANSVGYIGYGLTEQFTVGVCKRHCFYNGFQNQEKAP